MFKFKQTAFMNDCGPFQYNCEKALGFDTENKFKLFALINLNEIRMKKINTHQIVHLL